MNSRTKFLVVFTSTVLVAMLLAGAVMGKGASPEQPYRHLAVFTEVLSRIKSDYVEEPDLKSVTLGAMNGLLESIDPFASYLNAEQYKEYQERQGKLKADVGLTLSKRFGYVGVVNAVPGSPAAKAGIGTGDVIETIAGVSTRDMPLAYAQLLLKGQPGSSIELTVMRTRRPEPESVTLSRAVTPEPDLTVQVLPGNIGYLRPQSLSPNRVKEVAAAVGRLEKEGATKLVLDLRNTALGTPQEGAELADLFLDSGLITYLQGQKYPRRDVAASQSAATKMPLAVITNRGTAAAAEIAAAALLENKRAELVGERTYGDAALRSTIKMDDGGALILSVAKYYGPVSQKAIQDSGVTPNHPLAETEGLPTPGDDEAAPPAPADAPATQPPPGEDRLLQKAIEVLSGSQTASAAAAGR